MTIKLPRTICLVFIAFIVSGSTLWAEPVLQPQGFIRQVSRHIKSQLARDNPNENLVCQGEVICGLKLIPLYYQERHYVPFWMDNKGLRPAARRLIQAIKQADRDGLHPDDYHASIVNILLADYDFWPQDLDTVQAAIWADLDLLLTDAFLLLGAHLSGGRVNPETLHADMILPQKAIDVMEVLSTATTATQMEHILTRWRPDHDGYRGLRQALHHLRQLQAQGGWPVIADGSTLRPGSQDLRVPLLRQRLHISGDLNSRQTPVQPEYYDEPLKAAVQRFQRRHGLKPDGIIGKQTLAALNVPVDQRVRQIALNLERRRWLPRNLPQRYIQINAADFDLQVIENNQTILQMRVVVGRPARRTPVFSAPITYMVFNPYWSVPHTIAVEDILPKLTHGADYLAQHGFKVFNGWDENAQAIDPSSVNWKIYSPAYFPFRLRQDPGPKNALGQIKFMLPNKFSVYLHDTPQRSLFDLVQRDFSSGCIRVENAPALAALLLSQGPDWTPEKIRAQLSTGQRQIVRLSDPIPVYLLYMTAWKDEGGILQFRNDVYDRDRDLHNALQQRQPAPLPPLAKPEFDSGAYP